MPICFDRDREIVEGSGFDVVRDRHPTFENYRRRKPEPDFIEDTLSELGVSDGFYDGDSTRDVSAARTGGLEAALSGGRTTVPSTPPQERSRNSSR